MAKHRPERGILEKGAATPATADTAIEIDKITAAMSCPLDEQQRFAINVHWHAVRARAATPVIERGTKCNQVSAKAFPKWLADIDATGGGIELLLSRSGSAYC